MHGHNGRILRIDLTSGTVSKQSYDQDFARLFLGGNGFVAQLVYDTVPQQVDPLGEHNAIVFAVGPMTDTPVWGSSRGHLGAVSPLSGYFADSNFGGDFAATQKRTGFDAICIAGKSPTPAYISVTDQGAEIKDAADIWGLTTEQTNQTLQRREGDSAVAASIGPAGENLVLFASVIGGGRRPGAAGRGGFGAVMGSKNLKALVVRGETKTDIAQPELLRTLLQQQKAPLREATALLTDTGTSFLVRMINDRGALCTHNARDEVCSFADRIGTDSLKADYIQRRIACAGCAIACGKLVSIPSGAYAGHTLKMPEYETIYALGSMLDNPDIVSIMNANAACDLYGLDTISMGVTLSFVAECLEQKITSPADLGGRVDFSPGPALVDLIKATAHTQGIGKLLAQGSARLAELFGGEAYKYLYCSKSLELPGHSARYLRPMSLGYATGTRGGSHQDSRPQYLVPDTDPGFDVQPRNNIDTQHFTAVGDSLIMCRFLNERSFGSQLNDVAVEALNHVTGWNLTLPELQLIGERICNLERLISVRQGASRKDDTLPWRSTHEPISTGPAQGRYCPPETLEAMLDEYYRQRDWSPDGIPNQSKLRQLNLA